MHDFIENSEIIDISTEKIDSQSKEIYEVLSTFFNKIHNQIIEN